MQSGQTNSKGGSNDSPFYSNSNLFDSLSIFSKPHPDEYLLGWLFRLAHLNCIEINHMFEKKVIVEFCHRPYTNIFNYDSFLFKSVLTEKDWLRARSLSAGFDKLYIDNTRRFKMFFCPECLYEMGETSYFKKQWIYPFITRCPIHGSYLLEPCHSCGNSFLHAHRSWSSRWMGCPTCSKPLAKKKDHSQNDEEHVSLIGSKVLPILTLLENPSEEELLFLEKLFKMAVHVGNDFTHYSYWNYGCLQRLGVDLLKYSLSGKIVYTRFGDMTGGLAPDEALACAWDIWHEHPELFQQIVFHAGSTLQL